MDPNANSPWRVLDAPTATTSTVATSSTSDQRATTGDPPSVRPFLAGPAGRWAAAGIGIAACIAVALWLAISSASGTVVDVDVAVASDSVGGPPGSPGVLVVEVTGAVARPGVYRLPAGARVADLVDAAGGYGPRIDTARVEHELDLVEALADGARIRVPARGDPPANEPPGGGAPTTAGGGTALIDLNTATLEQLDTLPGIGPVTAAKIVAAREEAAFVSVDDLRSRGVLGEKTFERVRELVAVP